MECAPLIDVGEALFVISGGHRLSHRHPHLPAHLVPVELIFRSF